MRLNKLIFTNNDCYKAKKTIKPKGIMLHSTGAPNPRLHRYVGPDDGQLGPNKYNNHWNQKMSRNVCYHAFSGVLKDEVTIATYQVLPWDHRGWHCYKGKKGSGNDIYISLCMCEDDLNDQNYAYGVLQEVIEVSAYLCKMYNLNPFGKDVIIDHARGYKMEIASNHGDILHWFKRWGITLDWIRQEIAKQMQLDPKLDTIVGKVLYRVQVGSFSVKEYADAYLEKLKKAGFDGYIKTEGEAKPDPKPEPVKQTKVKVTATKGLNIRAGAGTSYKVLAVLRFGAEVFITEEKSGWGYVPDYKGWISLTYVKKL